MHKSKKIMIALVFAIFLISGVILFLIFGTTTGKIIENKNDINVAYLPYDASLVYFVAKEEGYFEQIGLNVNEIEYKSFKDVMDALIIGRVDAIIAEGSSTLIAAEAKSPGSFKIFQPGTQTNKDYVNYILIPENSKIDSIQDLKNKRVGSYKSSTAQLILELIATNVFDDKDAYEIIQVSPDIQAEALVTGQFDALYTIEPYATIVQEKTGAKILEKNPVSKYIFGPWPSGGAIISIKYFNENPTAVNKLIIATDKAVDFIRDNPSEAKKLVSKYTPIDEETALKTNTYHWQKSTEMNEEDFKENMQKLADLLYEQDVLDKKIDTSNLYIKQRV